MKKRSQHSVDVFNVCVTGLRIGSPQVIDAVANIYPIDERFVPITNAEMNEIFGLDIDHGWDNFQTRYPHTRGTLSVSDIGFDDA